MVAKSSYDKALFALALLLLLAAAGWFFLQGSKIAILRVLPGQASNSGAYVPSGTDAPSVSTQLWPRPGAQSRGSDWVYDVFTPPEIYYDVAKKEFRTNPPILADIAPVEKVVVPFGLELIEVRPELFPIQLVGYVGTEGSYLGTFENVVKKENFLGRSGKKLPELGFTIKQFEVKRNRITLPNSMPVYETTATALVVNDKTGEEVSISNRERRFTGAPWAVFKVMSTGQTVEHRAGEKFTLESATYTVGTVALEPASAEVTKEAPDLEKPETKTLAPLPPAEPASAPAAEKPAEPATSPFPFPTTP